MQGATPDRVKQTNTGMQMSLSRLTEYTME